MNRWKFILTDYTFNANGVATELKEEPLGWRNIELMLARDKQWLGVFFDASVNKLGYHGAGAAVLTAAYEQAGLNAQTDLTIYVACDDTDSFTEFYRGRILYADYSVELGDACIVSVSVEAKSTLRTLRSRYSHKVDILKSTSFGNQPLPAYAAIPTEIQLPSRPIVLVTDAEHDDCATNEYGFIGTDNGVGDTYTRLTAFQYLVKKDDLSTFNGIFERYNNIGAGAAYDVFLANDALIPTFEYTGDEFDCLESPAVLSLQVIISGTVSNSVDVIPGGPQPYNCSFRLYHFDLNGNLLNELILQTLNGDYQNSPEVTPININTGLLNYTINPGDKFYLIMGHDSQGFAGSQKTLLFTDPVITWNASVPTVCPDTFCSVVPVNEAVARVVESITDNELTFVSEFFGRTDSEPFDHTGDGCAGLTAITSGLLIRRASTESSCSEDGSIIDGVQPSIFVSLEELFKNLNAIYNIGITLEDNASYGNQEVVRIEHARYFFQDIVLLTIDNVKKIDVSVLEDRVYGKVEIGYTNWQTEHVNGSDEIFSTREHRTQIIASPNSYRQLCDFVAGGYAIEDARRAGASTTDTTWDDKIFILCLDRFYGGFAPEVFSGLSTQNILSPQNILNLRISPIRMLLNHYKNIRTKGSDRLFFNAGTGNFSAATHITNPVENCILEQQNSPIGENSGVTLNSFKPALVDERTPITRNEEIAFEAPLSMAQYLLIKSNPMGRIRVTQRGTTLEGYINKINWKPNTGLAKFSLLRVWS